MILNVKRSIWCKLEENGFNSEPEILVALGQLCANYLRPKRLLLVCVEIFEVSNCISNINSAAKQRFTECLKRVQLVLVPIFPADSLAALCLF